MSGMLGRTIGFFNTFSPYSTEYIPGTYTISIPVGAATVTIECLGAGAPGWNDGGDPSLEVGGGGAAYSKRITYSVAGLSAIYLVVATPSSDNTLRVDTYAKENNSSGTTICLAAGGGDGTGTYKNQTGGKSTSCIGDVKNSGGNGSANASASLVAGGGAGGETGSGGNASGATGGTGNSPGANGGNANTAGSTPGGGGSSNGHLGGNGWAKFSWT